MSGWGDTSTYGARPQRARPQSAAPGNANGNANGSTNANGNAGGSGGSGSLDDISRNVQKFSGKVVKIENMCNTLGGPNDNREFRKLFEKERQGTQGLAKEISNGLQAFQVSASEKAQYDKVRAQFNTVLQKFESVNRNAQRKEKELVATMSSSQAKSGPESHLSGGGARRNDFGDSRDIEDPNDIEVQVQDRNSRFDRSTVALEHQMIREQNNDIMRLEEDLNELSSMYVDMAVMVNEQSKDIDLIENNVSKTSASVEKGIDELKKSRELQKKARKKMCCIIGMILVCAVVGIVVYFAMKK
eukprot:ANDGO_01619.mRNA.1 Syntaxin-7A